MLTMREAARRAGCSKDTIWRAVQSGQIAATEAPGKGPNGRQIVLDAAGFEDWMVRRSDGRTVSQTDSRSDRQSDGRTVGQNVRSQPKIEDSGEIELENACSVVSDSDGRTDNETDGQTVGQTVGQTESVGRSDGQSVGQTVGQSESVGRSDGQAVGQMVPLEAHIEALRQLELAQTELRLMERRLGGTEVQLATWKHVLSEQQSELHQLRARSLHLEAKLLALPAPASPTPVEAEPAAPAEAPKAARRWWVFWR